MERGRPKENDKPLVKYQLSSTDYKGGVIDYFFDRKKHKEGTVKTVITPHPGMKDDIEEIVKNQKYGMGPTVVVFKNSTRKNAKTKMKIFNKNIDTVLTHPQAGLPDNAIILDIAVGESYIKKFESKYNL